MEGRCVSESWTNEEESRVKMRIFETEADPPNPKKGFSNLIRSGREGLGAR